MKIKSVQVLAVDVGFQKQALQTTRVASPMSRWPEYAERRASWMWPTKKAFVRIECTDGLVGWSCTNGGEVTELIVRNHLARMVEGRTVDDIAELWDQMFFSLLPHDRSGFPMMAIAAVDIALWDLKAKRAGKPLVQLLGGTKHEKLHSYATTSRPEELAADGWWGLKAAIPFGPEGGAEGMAENIALMQRFRDSTGPDSRIMLDAFMAWDADYALAFVERSRDLDIFWVEDPLPPYDLEGLQKIRKEADRSTRLALGNFVFNRWDCEALIREGLVDILQPDVAWAGGLTECKRIIEMAEAAEIPVILHNTYEQPWALALAASKQVAPIVEFVDRGETSELYSLMGAETEREQGFVAVPSSPDGNRPPQRIMKLFGDGSAPVKHLQAEKR